MDGGGRRRKNSENSETIC